MNRGEALRLSGGTLMSLGTTVSRGAANVLTLPQLAFSVSIGPYRGVGVLFDDPLLVIQDDRAAERRLTIPRADLQTEPQWRPTPEPRQPPATDVGTQPGSDVIYGRIRDRATALCRATGGIYVAMLAFPTLPYLVHYDADRNSFRTYPLPSSQQVVALFEQPGRLYYFIAGTSELRSVVTATG